ncbi:malectin domain-containing carbohydrate-binding protein [Mucilaginibacter lacusdianchii]|uniref:malectin domain-containing carbohydrate-binding protein n=1 Tax=Mucilaginibacter lacusdianchii TaxID=2684211 RepID=UPI00131C5FD8|nr:malectin domain-containing carbohydrate-binding protein [Mucilaginibacter sp. JXJ CY 39]
MILSNRHTLSSKKCLSKILLQVVCLLVSTCALAQLRQDISINNNWRSIANNTQSTAYAGFENQNFDDKVWSHVTVPHNWDTYEGYRRLKHGNRHGYAWYRKTFTARNAGAGKRYFLWFEGVSSYATVWLNGKKVGYHAGGRTSFTLDVTEVIQFNKPNLLSVRADHPANIADLPWVCGGCSDEIGFSEGSQPMGIFRPVHLMVTNPVRVEPFGVHIWNDTTVSEKSALLNLETEVKNYTAQKQEFTIVSTLLDKSGKEVAHVQVAANINSGSSYTVSQKLNLTGNVHLWSLQNPYLYSLRTQIRSGQKVIDETTTTYGIRWVSWGIDKNNGDGRFYLNGKPVFINGIGEYEHLMGRSHAFTSQEIKARVMQTRAAGFNAFRDAHQPHNLEYQKYWDELGLLWWPQYSAHIWFNTPAFRANYKALLVEWVKERRNSPSVILWGLENESKLPEDFARECTELIRKLDPTASVQRKVTTCNGGKGTDWDVPQNWTGTYGGNPLTYAEDLQKQILIGEYGAWRSLELHTEGPFVANGPVSEDRMAQLMETKVRLAESVKGKVAGQFHWLLYSHENPGRIQGGEGLRELDRVGPINYKGLFTPWGLPLDVFYMYRANYASKDKEPMIYIVSHTWPNRWVKPGRKDSITVYSNCDEVELFNDVQSVSFGKKKRQGIGTHFQWDDVNVQYNVLYAVGYVNGKAVAKDYIVLNHLPKAPRLNQLSTGNSDILKPVPGQKYLYRVNCGGDDYQDGNGNLWQADRHQSGKNNWGSLSWTDDFEGMPAFFASQQRTFDVIKGTNDSQLFQSFRYGTNKLKYSFPVPDGDYQLDLYFTEPWYGIGGGMDCSGWRLFNVAVNDKIVLHDLDVWKEAGTNQALKKTIKAHITGGQLILSFPNANAGEAIISAIAVSTLNQKATAAPPSAGIIQKLDVPANWKVKSWLDIGDKLYADRSNITLNELPPVLYGADWLQTASSAQSAKFTMGADGSVYVAIDASPNQRPSWLKDYEVSGLAVKTDAQNGQSLQLYRKLFKKDETVVLGENAGYLLYTIAVLPSVKLEPATDLRKTVTYKADNALTQGATVPDTLSGKKVIRFTGSTAGTATFILTPGVADLYALRIKYYNQTDKSFTGKMELQAADGTVMKTENVTFKPVQKGKSGTVTTTTGTSINAGNYKLIISAEQAAGLCISSIEMQ